MRPLKTSSLLLLLLTASCAKQPALASEYGPATQAAIGMLELKIGAAYPQSSALGAEHLKGALVVYDLPMPVGSLSGTFYDYSAQVDSSSGKLIAVLAKRTFSSLTECKDNLTKVLTATRVKYAFESERLKYSSFVGTSGPITAEIGCSTTDLENQTLTLSIFNPTLASEVQERFLKSVGR